MAVMRAGLLWGILVPPLRCTSASSHLRKADEGRIAQRLGTVDEVPGLAGIAQSQIEQAHQPPGVEIVLHIRRAHQRHAETVQGRLDRIGRVIEGEATPEARGVEPAFGQPARPFLRRVGDFQQRMVLEIGDRFWMFSAKAGAATGKSAALNSFSAMRPGRGALARRMVAAQSWRRVT